MQSGAGRHSRQAATRRPPNFTKECGHKEETMQSKEIPAVLSVGINSISTERALKQIKAILEDIDTLMISPELYDRIQVSIDDVELMLKAIR
jgi:hypothetical protein